MGSASICHGNENGLNLLKLFQKLNSEAIKHTSVQHIQKLSCDSLEQYSDMHWNLEPIKIQCYPEELHMRMSEALGPDIKQSLHRQLPGT